MSGGKGSTQTSTVQIPADVLARYNSVNAQAQQVASTPFQTYSGEFVAPINSTQQAGINATNAAANQAQSYYTNATNTLNAAQAATSPYYSNATTAANNAATTGTSYNNAATGLAAAGAAAVNPTTLDASAINQYMSPYLNDVVNSESALLNQNNQQAQSGQLGTAISSGAFGGDRAGVAAANLAQQQQLANASIYSNLLNTGYNNALSTAQQQQGVQLSAAQANRSALANAATQIAGIGNQAYTQGNATSTQLAGLGQDIYNTGAATSSALANLGTGAQTAALQGASAQLAAGTTAQQTQQAQDTALYNQFLQQQSYPFQVAQFLANIAEGTGSLSGSTTTTNSTSNGIFSDRHLKENIKPVGETFDGQKIYSYNYKGDDTPQIGLMAQEVERKHPEAVGLAGGYKTVDYGKATGDAAERGKFASGGLAAAGGGFDASGLAQMAANYQAMYGPLLSHSSNSLTGGSGIVPQSMSQPAHLQTAQAPAQQQKSAAQTANEYAGAANSIGSLGDKVGLWNFGGKGDDDDGSDAITKTGKKAIDEVGSALGLAAGGSAIDPYSNDNGGLNIPDDLQKYTLDAAKPPAQKSGGDDLMGLAKNAISIASMFKKGGRIERADGGEVVESPVLDAIIKKLRPWEHGDAKTPDWDNDGSPGETEEPAAAAPSAKHPMHSAEESIPSVPELLKSSTVPQKSEPSSKAPMPSADESLSTVASLISRAEGTGKNPKSSAVGPFQFLNGTFRHYAGKVDPDLAKTIAGMNNSELSAFRKNNPDADAASRKMGEMYIADNTSALKKAGFEPSAGNVYLAHLLGTQGAVNVLRADPSTSLLDMERKGAITKGTVAANPVGKTAGDVIAWAGNRMAKMADKRGKFADGGAPDDLEQNFDSEFGPDAVEQRKRAAALDATPLVESKPVDVTPAVKAASDAVSSAPVPEERETPKWSDANVEPKHGFFKGLSHGDASSIIPLLSGVGALATTQTNNPLTAIAAGLGAGAQAAQGQRQFALEQRKTEAERLAAQTGFQALPLQAMRAKADYQQAVNGTTGQITSWLQQYQPLANALSASGHPDEALNGMIASLNAKVKANLTGGLAPSPNAAPAAQAAPAGVAAAAPVGGTGTTPPASTGLGAAEPAVSPNFGAVDLTNPAQMEKLGAALTVSGQPGGSALMGQAANMRNSGTAFNDKGNIVPIPGAIQTGVAQQTAGDVAKASIAARTAANDEAKAANEAYQSAVQMRGMLIGDDGKPKVLGGPLEKYRAGIGSLLMSAGVSPEISDMITRTNVTDSRAVDKLRASLAASAARGELGSGVANHPSEFSTMLNSTPGTQLPAAVSQMLIDKNVIPKARNTMAAATYANSLDPAKTDITSALTSWRQSHPWEESLQKPKQGAGKVYNVSDPSQLKKLPDGARFRDPNGVVRIYRKGAQ